MLFETVKSMSRLQSTVPPCFRYFLSILRHSHGVSRGSAVSKLHTDGKRGLKVDPVPNCHEFWGETHPADQNFPHCGFDGNSGVLLVRG